MSNQQAFAELARLLFPAWFHEDEEFWRRRDRDAMRDTGPVNQPERLVMALKSMAGHEPDAFHYERTGVDQWSASFGGPAGGHAAKHPEGWRCATTQAAIAHLR